MGGRGDGARSALDGLRQNPLFFLSLNLRFTFLLSPYSLYLYLFTRFSRQSLSKGLIDLTQILFPTQPQLHRLCSAPCPRDLRSIRANVRCSLLRPLSCQLKEVKKPRDLACRLLSIGILPGIPSPHQVVDVPSMVSRQLVLLITVLPADRGVQWK